MKARTTKKLLSVVLTIAMLFSLGMPAMATDGEQTTAPEKVCKNLTGCVEGAHDAECDLYVAPTAPEKVCEELEGCVDGAHDAECDLYVAPTASEKVCEELEGCVDGAHDAECDLYVAPTEPEKVCKNLTGCDEENNVHNADCDLYVAPESTCKGNCVLEGDHDTCMNAEEKAAADQAAEAAAKAAEEAKLIEDIKARIADLPAVEEVQAMDMAALTALNTEITAISQEIDKLTDKSVIDTASIAAVANELNARVQTLEELEETVFIAEVNDTQYATLQEAVDNANGGTITLLDNATGAGVVFAADDNVVIDLNGFTYTLSESVGSTAQFGTVGFYLWAGSNVTVKNGNINMVADKMGDDDTFFKMFFSYGNLTLTNVTLDCANGVAYDGSRDVGFIAVESDNGTVSINGSTSITNCNLSPETWTVTAYDKGAITIDTTGTINGVVASYSSTASVEIKNGTFTNSNTTYAQLYSAGGDISVSGGTFSGDVTEYLATGFKQENGKVVIDEEKVVAKIGDKSYFSLQEAVDAAGEGDTIILQKSTTGAGVVFDDDDNVVIDLNGNTYTLSESVGSSAQHATVGFYLWSGSTATVKNGTINMVADKMGDDDTFFKMFHSYGNLTLTDVTLDCANGVAYNGSSDVGFLAVESDKGTLAINGATSIINCSTLSNETWTVAAFESCTINTTGTIDGPVVAYGNNAEITITNGTFTNKNTTYAQLYSTGGDISVSGGTFSEDISEYIVPGYEQDENGKVIVADPVAEVNGVGYMTLQEAINAAGTEKATVTLLTDATENITIAAGQDIVLNTNGKTLTNNGRANTITNKGTLTINGNGAVDNIVGGDIGAAVFNDVGATATIENVKITRSTGGTAWGNSYYTVENHGTMYINAGTEVSAVGTYSALVENGWYYGYYNESRKDSVMVINGGTFSGGSMNVKSDAYSELTINNGTFKDASVCCVLNWNNVTINNGTFINNQGAVHHGGDESAYYSDGATHIASLTITGGNFTDVVYAIGAIADPMGPIAISGGLYKHEVSQNYCAEGYIPKDNGDGTFTVTNPIDTEEELIAAVAAAEDGDVIELAAEITLTNTLNVKDSIEITKGTVLGTIAVANGETLKYGMSTYTGEVTFTEGGIKLANGATGTTVIDDENGGAITKTVIGPVEEGLNADGNYQTTIGTGGRVVIEDQYGKTTYTGTYIDMIEESEDGSSFAYLGEYLPAGSTKTEEYADGNKYVYTGPITLNTDGTFEIGAGGSYDDGNTIIYGVATVGEKITLGAGGGVEVEGRKITVPYGADVDLETDKSGSKVTGFIINPLTDANGKDLATIEGIGTVYMTALGTVTLKWVDGSVVIDPAQVPVDTNNDGKIDLNIDRDGNGKPDLNVDKDGNYKLDATDDNVDTDGDDKPNYKIIKGANAVWYYGNTWGLSFTANGLFEDAKYGFQYVEIDDVKLDTKHYTGKSGSTVVTLDYDYLQTLSAGTHKITVVYPDGEASANFYIREASVVPDTGDNSQIGLWIAVFGVSVVALGIAAALIIKRRKNGEA